MGEVILPGAGWGTGSHETTQLCLQAITLLAPRAGNWRMLDFGAGSGILAIRAAKLGATSIDAVEIDEAGLAHGMENAQANAVEGRIHFSRTLESAQGSYELVVANILRPVLLEFAAELVSRIAPGGTLVLSGLVATDVPELNMRYGAFLNGREPEIYRRGEWRAIAWRT